MVTKHSMIKVETFLKVLTYVTAFIGYMSAARHVGILYALGFPVLCLVAVYLDYQKISPPRWFLNTTILLILIISFIGITSENMVVRALEVLFILIVLKFMEEKKSRDYLQIAVLSVFLLAGASLMSLDMIFLVYFIALIFLISAVTIMISYFTEDPALVLKTETIYKIGSKAMLIPLIVIPMAALLFVILPRTSYPMFNFLNRGGVATSGFSDRVTLGDVTGIQETDVIVFRAQMQRLPEDLLYWRGIVLDYFDGTSWLNRNYLPTDDYTPLDTRGRELRYTVYLEPSTYKTLFTLDKPLYITRRDVYRYDNLTYLLKMPIAERIKYDAVSVISPLLPERRIDRAVYLQLPEHLTKVEDLVHDLTRGMSTGQAVHAIATFFKQGGYRYSLQNLPVSSTPLEDFLFVHKYGNCEFFASAMAVMLRAAGIPARIVGGYRGGYYSDLGAYYAVPQKNAHVWVEAFVENTGWIRHDPTPASLDAFTSSFDRGFLFRARIAFDIIQYYWNIFVINYDLQKQFRLFRKLGSIVKKPSLSLSFDKKRYLPFIALIAALALIVWGGRRFILRRKTLEAIVLHDFLKKMERIGYTKKKSQGLEEFIAGLPARDIQSRAMEFVREFEKRFYRDRPVTRKDAIFLRQIVKDIHA